MNFRNKYVLAIDQGTTSSRAILFNHQGTIITLAQKPFQQYFPKPGWVEHDPNEIWYTQSSVIKEAMAKADVTDSHIACIGIANQRETTIIWDRETGFPVYNAIVWQDRRTADYCEELKSQGWAERILQKTGLVIDAYFSATKIKWILDNVKGIRERAERGELCFGTVDTWLVWKLTRGAQFITDVTNASRTMLFNIRTLQWDQELFDVLSRHSILGATMHPRDEPHWDAFTHGLTAAQEHHQTGLLSTLFSTRSRLLTSNLTSSSQGDYLSGLLIGHELCGLASSLLRDLPATTPIALIGSANLNSRYSQAFSHVFPDRQIHAIPNATEHGLWRIAHAAGLLSTNARECTHAI